MFRVLSEQHSHVDRVLFYLKVSTGIARYSFIAGIYTCVFRVLTCRQSPFLSQGITRCSFNSRDLQMCVLKSVFRMLICRHCSYVDTVDIALFYLKVSIGIARCFFNQGSIDVCSEGYVSCAHM